MEVPKHFEDRRGLSAPQLLSLGAVYHDVLASDRQVALPAELVRKMREKTRAAKGSTGQTGEDTEQS
ncbi:hypothetical protein [Streptomyces sp. NPDC051183]|uniref:hypothetical protein n=1 Tax=unclassified Streptomyces TaxID=2593676 RepID=UPI003439B952